MSHREVLKNVIKYGKREFAEKKPLTLKVLRMKSKSILTRGLLPSINIKQIGVVQFIVVAEYTEDIRIYSFNREGQLLGGENIDKNPKFLKELAKSTNLEYHLPKEKPKLSIDDITLFYKKEFEKALNRLNQLFGFNMKVPYTIIAHNNLKLRMGRMFGCAKTKNHDKLVITPEVYKKDIFEAIIIREIMYLYLRDLIVLFQDIEDQVVYWYDLAILFMNFYLKNERNEYFKNILEKTTMTFLSFQDGGSYYFSSKIIEIMEKNTKIYTTKEINLFLSNVFNSLKILKNYKIRFRYKEFANFFYELCDLFVESEENKFFKQMTKLDYFSFHLKHFKKTSEIDTESRKASFLYLIFSLLSNQYSKAEDLASIVQKLNERALDLIIKKDILNLEKLIDDAIIEYITSEIIQVHLNYNVNKKTLDLQLELLNNSTYIFQNFTYALSWKPKHRLETEGIEVLDKSIDLHKKLKSKYSFSILTNGRITLFCSISFTNPLNLQKRIHKSLSLKKIDL